VAVLGRSGDALLGLGSDGGPTRSLVRAFETARERGLASLAILGGGCDQIVPLADITISVPSSGPQQVQVVGMIIINLLCNLLDERINSGRRPQTARESTAWTTWELRVVGASRRSALRAVARS
jgi:D-sedoheptulose 7-phosphate isomerase